MFCYVTQVRNFGIGDMVRIVNDEEAVRALQSGHGGWNIRMKNVRIIDFLNQVIKIIIN